MSRAALLGHLATGDTTVCRCWRLTRADGVTYGFTDHDRDLTFDGLTHRADSGLTARALVQGTGLSVDNSEAAGVLSDAAIRDADVEAGRFDGAEVESWLVNWADPSQRMLRFRGALGEIRREGAAFTAELRGLTDLLNQPQGRSYTPSCQAILGDAACGVALGPLAEVREAESVEDAQVFFLPGLDAYADRWFDRGVLRVLEGEGAGLEGIVKVDRLLPDGRRRITLWAPIRAEVPAGTSLRLTPGCDKRLATCRDKFANVANFRGFPTIPGEDWLVVPPRAGDAP
ncbi:DUF2163 domain-containing protein [Wenxinia marina]|uniref:Bacteriophage phiJL001 Gp84 C-terminal domain-containing protein n=1 Tax=Wenxinia marina DSM 24838 TaxID=1123501 RepID=A0A0D0Q628_9RHOB|nr:DUF2163 domain-containing protein [Wenxinia marina]KIQ69929.1 phage conserved hypothetical protein [Wenxinia marina DSM 24838]GGL62243.1 hypothetical protein GCM10011392_16020 [Wenxinia marina]